MNLFASSSVLARKKTCHWRCVRESPPRMKSSRKLAVSFVPLVTWNRTSARCSSLKSSAVPTDEEIFQRLSAGFGQLERFELTLDGLRPGILAQALGAFWVSGASEAFHRRIPSSGASSTKSAICSEAFLSPSMTGKSAVALWSSTAMVAATKKSVSSFSAASGEFQRCETLLRAPADQFLSLCALGVAALGPILGDCRDRREGLLRFDLRSGAASESSRARRKIPLDVRQAISLAPSLEAGPMISGSGYRDHRHPCRPVTPPRQRRQRSEGTGAQRATICEIASSDPPFIENRRFWK